VIRVILPVADKYQWALRPFYYLFNTYWSKLQPVLTVGFQTPQFPLPDNFKFYSLGPHDPGPQYWSDELIETLNHIQDEHIVIMLEDYWLCRTADFRGIDTLHEYCRLHPEIIRMDLTTDRLYAGGMQDTDKYGCYDLVETKEGTPYQMSLQAAIWSRRHLLSVLKPGLNPWEVELQTEIREPLRVLGTRQNPIRYANVFNSGKPDQLLNLEEIPEEHLNFMRGEGWIK
jgi:hypothetical protein